MTTIVDRYKDKIAGVLSCFDRVLIRGPWSLERPSGVGATGAFRQAPSCGGIEVAGLMTEA